MMKLKQEVSGVFWDISAPDETRFIIQTLVNKMAQNPQQFIENIEQQFDFEIPLPGCEEGRAAYLQFNGKKYNLNAFKENVDATDEIAELFRLKFDLAKVSREAIAETYAGRAKEVYLEWITAARLKEEETGTNYLDRYFEEMVNVERTLQFVLNADPLYVVFYQKEGSEKLMYEFVVRDPSSGKLSFRNAFVNDFFKKWFSTPAVQNALSKIILN